jgi:hypothetical protein
MPRGGRIACPLCIASLSVGPIGSSPAAFQLFFPSPLVSGITLQGIGMSLSQIELTQTENPVDQIERIASHNQWAFDRDEEDEISIAVTGTWTEYNIAFTWLSDIEALHVACAFDLKVPQARRGEALALIALINEQLWIGHFDIWPQDGVIMFRHAMLLAGGAALNVRQCEAALTSAVVACERYYQAFQFVVWAGKSGREALDTAMLETKGEA